MKVLLASLPQEKETERQEEEDEEEAEENREDDEWLSDEEAEESENSEDEDSDGEEYADGSPEQNEKDERLIKSGAYQCVRNERGGGGEGDIISYRRCSGGFRRTNVGRGREGRVSKVVHYGKVLGMFFW